MACTSNTINFSKYLSSVKFNLNQIRSFYFYFRKFTNNSEKMRLEEFRNSLGIIGNNCGEFIYQRLFHLIKDPMDMTMSFDNYLMFLNLVNNGTTEEKLKHSFKFMDLENKGFVDKENFKKTFMALCGFFEKVSQSQSKIKEEDIDIIFKEILIKTEKSFLDFNEYLQLVYNYPEIFDFFDIFNNKLVENSMIVLNREHFGRLKKISEKLKSLLNKADMINLKYGEVTLALTKFIQKASKTEKKLDRLKTVTRIRENKSIKENNNNDFFEQNLLSKSLTNNTINKTGNKNFDKSNTVINKSFINMTIDQNNFQSKPTNKIFFLSEKVTRKDETFDDDEIDVSDISDEKDILNMALAYNSSDDDVVNDESRSENFLSNFSPTKKPQYQGQNSFKGKETNQINFKSSTHFEKSPTIHSYSKSINANGNIKGEIPYGEIKRTYSNNETKEFEEKSLFSNGKIEKESALLTNEKFSEFYRDKNFSFMKKDEFPNKSLEFDMLTPAPIMHPELSNAFKDYDLDPANCLIVTNKKNFIKWISDINDALKNVLNEIDPNKNFIKRRAAISKKNSMLTQIFEKEDYLNPSFINKEEEGLIHFGNPNVELVLNMMIGIRNSVNSLGESNKLYRISEKDEAFKEQNTFRFSQSTFEKELTCTFHDYAPKVFSNLRKIYGISNQNYLKSLGPENFLGNLILTKNRSLKELCSSGKSGSFFYYSYDSKFVMKTVSLSEFQFFQNIVEDYYFYMLKNKDTLLQRFYGLHCIHYNNEKIYIVIMNNVFNTNIKIHYKYDLKGSSHQRISRKCIEIDYNDYNYDIPLKDLDFLDREEAICISEDEKENLIKQIRMDSDFLSSLNINDYSLLIGIHNEDFYKNGTHHGAEKNMLFDFLRKINSPNTNYLSSPEKHKKFELLHDRKPFYQNNNGGLLSRDGQKRSSNISLNL